MLLWTPGPGFKVSPTLALINLIIFLILCVVNLSFSQFSSQSLLLLGANFHPLVEQGQWWRLLSSVFLHLSIAHLVFNCISLLFLGRLLEPILGYGKFLLVYLTTGILAGLASFWFNDHVISAGASGAIFGLFGIFITLLLSNIFPPRLRNYWLKSIGGILVLNLAMGLFLPIDNAAHIGGLISGILAGFFILPTIKKQH
jgi:rhomboid protease GluP